MLQIILLGKAMKILLTEMKLSGQYQYLLAIAIKDLELWAPMQTFLKDINIEEIDL